MLKIVWKWVCAWSLLLNLTSITLMRTHTISFSLTHTYTRTYTNTSTYIHTNTFTHEHTFVTRFVGDIGLLTSNSSLLVPLSLFLPSDWECDWGATLVLQALGLVPLLLASWFCPLVCLLSHTLFFAHAFYYWFFVQHPKLAACQTQLLVTVANLQLTTQCYCNKWYP